MLWEEGVVGGGCYGGWCLGRRVLGDGVTGGKSVQIQMCSVAMYY